MLWMLFGIYIVIGFSIFFWLGAYGVFPPPSRLVKVDNRGTYRYKDYVSMPHWLWCAILTVIWLPYLIWFLIEFGRETHL